MNRLRLGRHVRDGRGRKLFVFDCDDDIFGSETDRFQSGLEIDGEALSGGGARILSRKLLKLIGGALPGREGRTGQDFIAGHCFPSFLG